MSKGSLHGSVRDLFVALSPRFYSFDFERVVYPGHRWGYVGSMLTIFVVHVLMRQVYYLVTFDRSVCSLSVMLVKLSFVCLYFLREWAVGCGSDVFLGCVLLT